MVLIYIKFNRQGSVIQDSNFQNKMLPACQMLIEEKTVNRIRETQYDEVKKISLGWL